jgi:hypothetical protein
MSAALRVTHEGTTDFVATDREPKPLAIILTCPEGLVAATDVRLCSSSFHSHTGQWELDAVEVEGSDGRIALGHGMPRSWLEKTQGGIGPAGGGLIGRPVGEVYLCTVQVGRDLSAGEAIRFRLRATGATQAAVQGALRVKVREPSSEAFVQVGEDIPLHNTAGPPTRLEARVTADARDAGRLIVFATDEFHNPVPGYQAKVRLQADHPVEGLGDHVQTSEDGRGVVEGLSPKGARSPRIEVTDADTGLSAKSGPMLAPAASEPLYLFGGIHFHTWLSVDGDRDPRQAYAYARDILGLDFVAMADHAPVGPNWETCLAVNEEFNEPGCFVTIPAWESSNAYGHANVYLRTPQTDAGPWLWNPDVSPQEMALPADAILAPHHTSAGSDFEHGKHREALSQGIYWKNYDWSTPNPRARILEIVQARGCFEADAKDPLWGIGFAGRGSSARDALARGYRLGFVAGSDNHQGHPTLHRSGYVGLTCIRAKARTRDAVWQAMDTRDTYATSGVPIICDWSVNGHRAGSEAVLAEDGVVSFDARLHGTAPIALIEVISAGRCVWRSEPGIWDVDLSGVELPSPDGVSAYYYLRLRQADGHRAWLSPVWLDRKTG